VSPPVEPGGQDTYVVKKGDTLWGIARGLLNDPFAWPRIWERNPFITNPNRIFPGDTLGIREPAPLAEAPRPEAPTEPPKEEAKAPSPPRPAEPAFDIPPVPPVPAASEHAIACSPVLVEETAIALAGIGSIVRTDENRQLLAQTDRLFVGVDGPQTPSVGDRLAVIRSGIRVLHPRTRRGLGRVLQTLGVLEVTGVEDRTLRARVIYNCDAINDGDRVAPFVLAPFPADKVPQPTTRQVEGAIVDSPRALVLYGLQHLVFLDVGAGQGIGPGDVFAIYRPSAPAVSRLTGGTHPISPERRGEAVVIRVTERTATAVLTTSAKESIPGDRVVLSRQVQP
jgi:hypothetical protein